MNDKIDDINIKLDHLMRVTSELYIMMKLNNNVETKLDQCIKSINTMNSSLMTIINNQNRPQLPPPFPKVASLPPYKKPTISKKKTNNSGNKNITSGGYMEELKKKLKERNLKKNIVI
jgi:hypothetical protein